MDIKDCIYKGEHYRARDDGAVFRYQRQNERKRKYDCFWTYGKPDKHSGYMLIASERVHRIVAFAFLGQPPTPDHVVDHIDTNRRNNRPENLRWVTKLENALNNPITRKRIEYYCGSIEAFIQDPTLLNKCKDKDPNFEWMRTVSADEAKTSYENMLAWAEKENVAKSSPYMLGEWIYHSISADLYHASQNDLFSNEETSSLYYSDSLTPNAKQVCWQTPTEFLCCPKLPVKNPIRKYLDNLKLNKPFTRNCYNQSTIIDFAFLEKEQKILILSNIEETDHTPAIKPWGLCGIVFVDNVFAHINMHTFFTEQGARKQFTLEQGKEWDGGDSIDDYC